MDKPEERKAKCRCPYCEVVIIEEAPPICQVCQMVIVECDACGSIMREDVEKCPECGADRSK